MTVYSGFGAIGMDTFPVTDPEEGIKTLRVLAKSEYEIIYVTEVWQFRLIMR